MSTSSSYSELGYWVCASFQHLRSYSLQAENIDEFEVTLLAGELALFLNAIRGRGLIKQEEILRIAKTQKIGQRKLQSSLIPVLQALGSDRIRVNLSSNKSIAIEENLDAISHLYEVIGKVWEKLDPSLIDRGAVYVLRHTYVMPRTESEAIALLNKDGLADRDASSTLGVTTSFRIVQSYSGIGLDEAVLFNPYIWRNNQDKIAHVIVRLPDEDRAAVSGSLEKASKYQALPIQHLYTDRKLLTTAQSIGLIDVVEVNTADGNRQEFVFTPHLITHPNVTRLADDLLNDVRAVLACTSYGESFSRISRLGGANRDKTINTLRKLVREGEAGDATAIGLDYKLLEERGIIVVQRTDTPPGGRYKMRLLRKEPVEIALKIIEDSVSSSLATPMMIQTKNLDPAALFASPEQTRTQLAPALGEQPEDVKEARNHFLKIIRKEVF